MTSQQCNSDMVQTSSNFLIKKRNREWAQANLELMWGAGMRIPGRGHSMCKGQEVGTLSEVNELCWVILVIQWANLPEVPNTQSGLKMASVVDIAFLWVPIVVGPLGNSIIRKTVCSHPDHTSNSCHHAFITAWLMCEWPTIDHIYVKCTCDECRHACTLHMYQFHPEVFTCLWNPFLCYPPNTQSCRKLLIFFLSL